MATKKAQKANSNRILQCALQMRFGFFCYWKDIDSGIRPNSMEKQLLCKQVQLNEKFMQYLQMKGLTAENLSGFYLSAIYGLDNAIVTGNPDRMNLWMELLH